MVPYVSRFTLAIVKCKITRPITYLYFMQPKPELKRELKKEIQSILYKNGIPHTGSKALNSRIKKVVDDYYRLIAQDNLFVYAREQAKVFANRLVEEVQLDREAWDREEESRNRALKSRRKPKFELRRYVQRALQRCGIIFWCAPPPPPPL